MPPQAHTKTIMLLFFFLLVHAVSSLTVMETNILAEEPSVARVARMHSPGAYKVDSKAFNIISLTA